MSNQKRHLGLVDTKGQQAIPVTALNAVGLGLPPLSCWVLSPLLLTWLDDTGDCHIWIKSIYGNHRLSKGPVGRGVAVFDLRLWLCYKLLLRSLRFTNLTQKRVKLQLTLTKSLSAKSSSKLTRTAPMSLSASGFSDLL
ncbi:hypothetical protein HUJ05_009851 [Dendroctonus ponderosae]|nr:hypothetical protein HUJ05_009851 [Dendroctonus ponderosae]